MRVYYRFKVPVGHLAKRYRYQGSNITEYSLTFNKDILFFICLFCFLIILLGFLEKHAHSKFDKDNIQDELRISFTRKHGINKIKIGSYLNDIQSNLLALHDSRMEKFEGSTRILNLTSNFSFDI